MISNRRLHDSIQYKLYELEISEVITQQIRRNPTTIIYEGKLTTIGDYDLYDYTGYKINGYLTTTQLNNPTDT